MAVVDLRLPFALLMAATTVACGTVTLPDSTDDAGSDSIIDASSAVDALVVDCTNGGEPIEVCGNGADDDCNDIIDDPMFCDGNALIEILEDPSGAAWNPVDVFVRAVPAEGAIGSLECRSGKVPADNKLTTSFAACGTTRFQPSLDPITTGDGVYRTEIRLVHPNGTRSNAVELSYYLHRSLLGATSCSLAPSTDQLFAKALERLPVRRSTTTPLLVFDVETGVEQAGFAQLQNPFIRVNFTPRPSVAFGFGSGTFGNVHGKGDGVLKALSLRRRFRFNAERTLLLIDRRYAARRGPGVFNTSCRAMYLLRNGGGGGTRNSSPCDAVVLNREGAGVCLRVSGTTISINYNPRATFFSDLAMEMLGDIPLTDGVDNALWRKLGAVHSPTPASRAQREACSGTGRYTCAENGYGGRWGSRNFSPKCFGSPNCTSELENQTVSGSVFDTLFLPDDQFFRF